MNHSELMQFKDEMLKNLREMERKIMTKVNKNQTDFSTDLMAITKSVNSFHSISNHMWHWVSADFPCPDDPPYTILP